MERDRDSSDEEGPEASTDGQHARNLRALENLAVQIPDTFGTLAKKGIEGARRLATQPEDDVEPEDTRQELIWWLGSRLETQTMDENTAAIWDRYVQEDTPIEQAAWWDMLFELQIDRLAFFEVFYRDTAIGIPLSISEKRLNLLLQHLDKAKDVLVVWMTLASDEWRSVDFQTTFEHRDQGPMFCMDTPGVREMIQDQFNWAEAYVKFTEPETPVDRSDSLFVEQWYKDIELSSRPSVSFLTTNPGTTTASIKWSDLGISTKGS